MQYYQIKIYYLSEYANNAIKGKDKEEAKEALQKAEERMKILKKANVDVSHLEYLIDGVKKKGI